MSLFLKICTGLLVAIVSLGTQANAQPLVLEQVRAEPVVNASNTTEVIQALYIDNSIQMKAAALVQLRSTDEDLLEYAERIARDHRWMNRMLETIANLKSVSLEPEEMSENAQLIGNEMASKLETLVQLPESKFRAAFVSSVVESHLATLDFYNRIEKENTDDSLSVLVKIFRQFEENHLSNAQKL